MLWTPTLNIKLLSPLFLLALVFSCRQEEKPPVPFPGKAARELDTYIPDLQRKLGLPGIAVVVIKDDAVYYRTAGNSWSAAGEAFTDSTVFFTGSLSEPVVATAILQLAEEGKVSLDSPVVNYLPYFKMAGTGYRHITIRHLLTHSSGIPKHSAEWDIPNYAANSLELTTHSISLQEPKFTPAGSRIVRSPYNYDILADLIAKVGRISFEDQMSRLVFQPLRMDASTFFKTRRPGDRLAHPYKIANWLTYDLAEVELYPYNREHAGSIGFHTTVKDITRWIYMLLHNGSTGTERFLGMKWCEELVKPQLGIDNDTYIGLGWEIKRMDGELVLNKSHQLGGFSEDLTLVPGQKTGVLVVSNIGENFNAGVIAAQLISWLKGQPLHPPAQSPEIDTLLGRYEQYLSLTLQPDAKEISNWINTLDPRSQWPDISYEDSARGKWDVIRHLKRVRDLAAAWAIPQSPFYHKQVVWQTFSNALDHWLAMRYRNSNWWQNEIGVPQYMRDLLILTRRTLSPGQFKQAMEVLAQLKVQGTGANLIWSGDLGIHYAALSGDGEKIREYLGRIINEIKISRDNGVQPDYSFHQHGPRLQMYQYGKAFLQENIRLAWQLRATPWAYPEEKVDLLTDFVLKGWQWMARGIHTVPGTMDRSASREGELRSADLRGLIPFFLALQPKKADEFRSIADRQNGKGSLSGYRYYPYSDFSAYHDKAFSFFLKTISDRTLETESINRENLKGHWLNDGDAYLVHDGEEYYDLMPVWNWDLLPGITGCREAVKPIRQPFTGTVSDGGSGLSVMDYRTADKAGREALSTHKCWAVHGNTIVCLLADIRTAHANDTVYTVLDQCRWRGDVTVNRPGNIKGEGEYKLEQVKWIYHAGFAYIPLTPAAVNLQLKTATGSWAAINLSQSPAPVAEKVFLPVLLHPLHVQGQPAAYVLASCSTAEQAGRLAADPSWKILRNDKDCQAVGFNDGTIMAAFFSPATLKAGKRLLQVDRPCLVMIAGNKVFASDPACTGGAVKVTWMQEQFVITLPKDGTTISLFNIH